MEASLAKRIAQALADAENPSSDRGGLSERLESLASEAAERYQLLGVARSYLILDLYDEALRCCDAALHAPGDVLEESIAYHYKGRSLRFIGKALSNEGQAEAARLALVSAIECFERSITDAATDEFVLGSLTNLAHVHEQLGRYRDAIHAVKRFVSYRRKSAFELPAGTRESMRELLLRSYAHIKRTIGMNHAN